MSWPSKEWVEKAMEIVKVKAKGRCQCTRAKRMGAVVYRCQVCRARDLVAQLEGDDAND
jgi:hypothetical protein